MFDDQLFYRTGEGGETRVNEEALKQLKDELDAIRREADGMDTDRQDAAETRYCRWDGQDRSGRLLAKNNSGEEPFPFEGACDGRYRLADQLVTEDVALAITATARAHISVRGLQGRDSGFAGRIRLLLRWITHTHLGARWLRELIKLAQYVYGDTPGAGLLKVYWHEQYELEMRQITIEELAQLYVNQAMIEAAEAGADEQAALEAAAQAMGDYTAALQDPTWGLEDLANSLRTFFPHLRPAKARKVVSDLQETGTAEFPAPALRERGPRIEAKRIYRDVLFPANTQHDFDHARVWIEPQWLSQVELESRILTDGWRRSFVDKVLEHEKEGYFKPTIRPVDQGNDDSNDYRGLYQVVVIYFQGINRDGLPGRYYTVIHPDVDEAAHERRMLRTLTGRWPAICVTREVLTDRVLDTRGVPDLAATDQSMVKLYMDSFGNTAQLSGVPPVSGGTRITQMGLTIGPAAQLPTRPGEVEYMKPPEYPRTVGDMMDRINRMVDAYHGRHNDAGDPELTRVIREFKVTWWLSQISEIYKMLLQTCQQYMPDEMLQRITEDESLLRGRDEIQGEFDLNLHWDSRDLDPEHLKILGEIIGNVILAMDREQTIERSALVEILTWRLSPEIAEDTLRSRESAGVDEITDELQKFQMISLAGIEPPMDTSGNENYGMRLELYQRMLTEDPDAWQRLSEDKRDKLQRRIEHLEHMTQQFDVNAQTGRTGVEPAPAE